MIPCITPTRYTDPGIVGLAYEVRAMTTAELVEQRDLISDIHPALWHVARPRLALVRDELARRGEDRQPLRLLTPADLMREYGS